METCQFKQFGLHLLRPFITLNRNKFTPDIRSTSFLSIAAGIYTFQLQLSSKFEYFIMRLNLNRFERLKHVEMSSVLWLTYAQHLFSTGELFIFRQILLLGVSFSIHFSFALLNKGIVQFLRKPFLPLLGRLLYKLNDLKSSF